MDADLVALLTIFVLAIFVGFEVITKVPPLLHTPLMSGANAISGITLVGSLIAAGAGKGSLSTALGFAAIVVTTTTRRPRSFSAVRRIPTGSPVGTPLRTSKDVRISCPVLAWQRRNRPWADS